MPVRMYVGMVTILCMHGPIWVYVYHLTQRSDNIAGGVGACDGCVSVIRPGDSAARFWPEVQ
jgi:hypothetical protein